MGTNMLICVVNSMYENDVKEKLNNYQIITLCEKDKNHSILFITLKRKDIYKISKIIKIHQVLQIKNLPKHLPKFF